MKIGIIMVLIGAGLLAATYFSYTQVSLSIANSQSAQASSNTNVWQTTFILGFVGLFLLLIGINVITSSIKRRAIRYVENKVGNKFNDMGMGSVMSNMPIPFRSKIPMAIRSTFMNQNKPSPPPAPTEPTTPPKDVQSPPDTNNK